MNTAMISGRNAAHGGTRTYRVQWKTQTVSCCGQKRTIAEPDSEPCYVDSSYGRLMSFMSQCRQCGSSVSPKYSATEVTQ
jgi:hypothetical protein